MKLYGVYSAECAVMKSGQLRPHGVAKNLMPLFPRDDGRYFLSERKR